MIIIAQCECVTLLVCCKLITVQYSWNVSCILTETLTVFTQSHTLLETLIFIDIIRCRWHIYRPLSWISGCTEWLMNNKWRLIPGVFNKQTAARSVFIISSFLIHSVSVSIFRVKQISLWFSVELWDEQS